jgi:hypothetical protein
LERVLCITCDKFLLPKEHEDHKGHDLKTPIDDEILKKPSLIASESAIRPTYNHKKILTPYRSVIMFSY